MMFPGRRLVLFSLLIATVGAAIWVSQDRDDTEHALAEPVSKPVSRKAPATVYDGVSPALSSPAPSVALPSRVPMAVGDLNPFNVKSWYVPPPPPPPPEPPKPTAPPLPFVYQGKLEEGPGVWVFYLLKGEQFYAVRKGETFDSVYRLEDVAGGNLVIQYLPMGIQQTLPIGADF